MTAEALEASRLLTLAMIEACGRHQAPGAYEVSPSVDNTGSRVDDEATLCEAARNHALPAEHPELLYPGREPVTAEEMF